MGDEELNFTEMEAQCWADDPRNQAHGLGAGTGIVAVCILLLAALIAFVFATSSGPSRSDSGVTRGGEVHVGRVVSQ